ncbi:MAG: VOC family protein [Micrococcales bacterium]|nr:VOC family protein [Micrococcales bacterium]
MSIRIADARVVPILLAPDLAASTRFWTERIGLPIQQQTESAVTLGAGAGTSIRLSASTEGTTDSQTQLDLVVEDVRAAVDALRAKGVQFEDYDSDEVTTVDGVADQGDAYVAWFTDPGGNVVGVEQAK